MNARDASLLPRLMVSLDTLDNDAEIVAAVRRIRLTGGDGFFAKLLGDLVPVPASPDISLHHSEREIGVRLRGLGLMLRLVRHPDPAIAAALHRTREALIAGGNVAEDDLVLTIALLRDLFAQEITLRTGMERLDPDIFWSASIRQDLRDSMHVLLQTLQAGR